MDRFLSVAVNELRQNLADTINKSGVPFCVLQVILNDILIEINMLAQREYEIDLEAMKKSKDNQQKEAAYGNTNNQCNHADEARQ